LLHWHGRVEQVVLIFLVCAANAFLLHARGLLQPGAA